MRYKGLLVFFLISCTIFFLVNFYARKNFSHSYAFQLGYDQLYINDSSFYIKKVYADKNDFLHIQFAGTPFFLQNIKVKDSAGNEILHNAYEYTFPAAGGKTSVFIKERSKDSLIASFIIEYTSAKEFGKNGRISASEYQLLDMHIPFVKFKPQLIDKWAQPEEMENKSPDFNWRTFFTDTLKIQHTDPTLQKIEKIFAYMLPISDGHYGIPADSLVNAHPYDFLQAVKDNKTKIWCGNYATLLGWFCAKASIKTRLVSTALNGINFGNHTFCEVFVPELRKWILCDPTNHFAYIRKGDYYFNTIDLYRFLKANGTDSNVVAGFFNASRLSETPLVSINNGFDRLYNANSEVWFYYADYLKNQNDHSLQQRLLNMIFVKPNYALYSDASTDLKYEFYIRMWSGYLFIFCFLGVCVLLAISVWNTIKR